MASVFYYLFFLLFTILCFIPFALLYVLTVKFDRERVVLHRVSRIWSMGIYRLCPLWRLKVAGREKIDRGKAYVIAHPVGEGPRVRARALWNDWPRDFAVARAH